MSTCKLVDKAYNVPLLQMSECFEFSKTRICCLYILSNRKYSLEAKQFQKSFHSNPLKYAQLCVFDLKIGSMSDPT